MRNGASWATQAAGTFMAAGACSGTSSTVIRESHATASMADMGSRCPAAPVHMSLLLKALLGY